jgi:hypothetical protein
LGIPNKVDPAVIVSPKVYFGKLEIVPNCGDALSFPTEP